MEIPRPKQPLCLAFRQFPFEASEKSLCDLFQSDTWPFFCLDDVGRKPTSSMIGTEFGEGDAAKQSSVKKSDVSLNEGKAFSE